MGMGPYFPFISWVWFRMRWMDMKYKFAGLVPRLVELDDGATKVHCWVPKKRKERPALLLLQGFGMTGAVGWEHQAPAFAKKFDVYVPDLLFFGKSITTDAQRSEIFQGECIKKMLDALEVDQVHLVGTSYGGMVAYYLAGKYPKLVDKAVIASSGVMMNPTTNDRLVELAKVSSIKDMLVPADVKNLRVGMNIASIWRTWMLPDFVLQDLFDWFHKEHTIEKKELIDGMITGSKGAPPVPVITQDVLILWGTQDKIFLPELAEQLRSHLGDKAKLVYIDKCGHVPQIERPSEYNKQILQFLST